MDNDKAKRKLEIFDFVEGVIEKYDSKDCLSLASSLLITAIADIAGHDAAYDFAKDLNGLIMVTLGCDNMTVNLSHKEVKK